jgi:hypothetical protein
MSSPNRQRSKRRGRDGSTPQSYLKQSGSVPALRRVPPSPATKKKGEGKSKEIGNNAYTDRQRNTDTECEVISQIQTNRQTATDVHATLTSDSSKRIGRSNYGEHRNQGTLLLFFCERRFIYRRSRASYLVHCFRSTLET